MVTVIDLFISIVRVWLICKKNPSSYYFDCFSKYILEDKLCEDELMRILERVDEYEDFLRDIYYEIKKTYDIPEITWLLKKNNP